MDTITNRKIITIRPSTPTDPEVDQLRDVGKQVTKYIYSKVNAHPKQNISYKEALSGHKLILILPEISNDSSNITKINELRGCINNIIKHGKQHNIEIEMHNTN
tara:strand:- start:1582 stop:1893 length:312 start_codon:yes stop_codon:yes gene_type:complete